MSRESVLARGRAAAEQGMTSTCTSRRQSGTPVYDDNTGGTTPGWTAVYSGPCRLKQPSPTASSSTVGESAVMLVQPEIHLPMDAPLHKPGDEITMTACPEDPLSAGRMFHVKAMSGATARRYSVIERTG